MWESFGAKPRAGFSSGRSRSARLVSSGARMALDPSECVSKESKWLDFLARNWGGGRTTTMGLVVE